MKCNHKTVQKILDKMLTLRTDNVVLDADYCHALRVYLQDRLSIAARIDDDDYIRVTLLPHSNSFSFNVITDSNEYKNVSIVSRAQLAHIIDAYSGYCEARRISDFDREESNIYTIEDFLWDKEEMQ